MDRDIATASTQQVPRNELYSAGNILEELILKFPDEASAEAEFALWRWGENGRLCPRCSYTETTEIQDSENYWCRRCRRRFSVRTGTVLEHSHIPLRKWIFAIHLCTSSEEGITSVQLHKDLQLTQKSAWHMAKKIRSAWNGPKLGALEPGNGRAIAA